MTRILFADDEARVPERLRDPLRARRRESKTTIALGANAALARRKRERFDIAVCDAHARIALMRDQCRRACGRIARR